MVVNTIYTGVQQVNGRDLDSILLLLLEIATQKKNRTPSKNGDREKMSEIGNGKYERRKLITSPYFTKFEGFIRFINTYKTILST